MSATSHPGTHPGFVERIGLPRPLLWGFVGTLLFMIGDGVESAYLSPFLVHRAIDEHHVAILVTIYGIAAAISSWLSGALSDMIGPRRVMMVGMAIWIAFEILFLTLAIPTTNYGLMILFYGIRGFGYPLFAFGFLVWIVVTVNPARLGSAVGWFWFAFTGGLPTLGSAFARGAIPLVGTYGTLWLSLVLVTIGALVGLFGLSGVPGGGPQAGDQSPLRTLLASFHIARVHTKVALGCIVRAINTSAEFGFLVMLPIYFTKTLHFSLAQWLEVTTCIFASNIAANLLFGVVGDWFGWRRTVVVVGGIGCAISTLVLYYVPTILGPSGMLPTLLAGAFYGVTLAGYVPLSALMPYLAPEDKPAAMSMLNLGAGASVWVGPAIVAIFQGWVGVLGVMCIYSIIYLASAIMASFLSLDPEVERQVQADRAAGVLVAGH